MKSRIVKEQKSQAVPAPSKCKYECIVMSNGDKYENAVAVTTINGKNVDIEGWLTVVVNKKCVALNGAHISSIQFELPQECEEFVE